MTGETPSARVSSWRRAIALVVVFLPTLLAVILLVGFPSKTVAHYLLQAACFASLPGMVVFLGLKRAGVKGWLFIIVCTATAAWSLYQAYQVWGGAAF